ncbi:MAG: 50S ribosomal protein L23 [Cyanobacteria bacterium P01_E01_bin.6]
MPKLAPRDLPDLIRRPIVTEKATILLEENYYTFEVLPTATKPDIRAAIEQIFDVKVVSVKTHNPPRKKRRMGRSMGYKPHYKKAIVKLAEGDSITLFPEV